MFRIIALLSFVLLSTVVSAQKSFISNKVIAHRGAWKQQKNPQNTLASFDSAVELGCEGSEFDVWMTADGVLVVNHDPDYMGMPIETTDYETLLTKKHENGEKLATVEEYLANGKKQKTTKMIFEIKPSKISIERSKEVAEKSVLAVKKMKAKKWVDYITFSYEGGLKVIEMDPSANVAYLNGDKTPAELKEVGFFGFDYNLNVLKKNPHWIKEAKDLGLTVNAWTVNEKEDMEWLLKEGADFITTDEPELLLSIVNSEK